MSPRNLAAVFESGRFEVGLKAGCNDGDVVVIEAPDPISTWVYQTFGVPFAMSERLGLHSLFYCFSGLPFDNPLHPARESVICIHSSVVVIAPDTPQPAKKMSYLRRSSGDSCFERSWVPELVREAGAWAQARREAMAIYAGKAGARERRGPP